MTYHESCIIELHEASLQDYEDMVKIDALSEPVLLHNLQQRYNKDLIYVSKKKNIKTTKHSTFQY